MSALASTVSCQEFVELVTLYSERALAAERRDAFEEHLLVCPACRIYSSQVDHTTRLLARLRSAEEDAPADEEDEDEDEDEDQSPPPPHPTDGSSSEREYALKFLASGRLAPFSRTRWPEPHASDPWVTAGDTAMCLAGIHACTLDSAPFWLNDELWIVELEGVVERAERKVLARRGRLVDPVEAWNEDAQARFASECVDATRSAVVEVIQGASAGEAPALAERALDADLEEAGRLAGDASADSRVREAWSYLAACLQFADAPASVAFGAAIAAEHSGGPGGAAGERARQAAWLRKELALDDLLAAASEAGG